MSLFLSVIVSVYNVEKYIAECLDSILSQEGVDFEVICVNDASPDRSIEILQDYAERDSRVRVVNLEKNGGVSHARNIGMSLAQGEYLLLIDGDDKLEAGFISSLYELIRKTNVDRVGCSYRYFYQNNPARKDVFMHPQVTSNGELWAYCSPQTIGKVHYGANVIIRRSIVEKHQLKFSENIRFAEDLQFHYICFPHCEKVAILSAPPFYVYRKHSESATCTLHTGNALKVLDYIEICRSVMQNWQSKGLWEDYRIAWLKMLFMCVRNIRKYAPHSSQAQVTRDVCEMLNQTGVFDLADDRNYLSKKEWALLRQLYLGKSGMTLSYYWKRMRKKLNSLFK